VAWLVKRWRDPVACATTADIFAILIAVSLPWSTTLVAIFAAAFILSMVPLLDVRVFLQSLKRPDLRLADCAVCARGSRNAVVGCAVGDKALRHRSALETADVAACCSIILNVLRAAYRCSSPSWRLVWPCW